MGDEEFMAEDQIAGEQEPASGGRLGFIPVIILKILKWVALALAAIMFIVTVVIITVNFLVTGPQTQAYPSASPEYRAVPPILSWYDIPEIRGRTSDENPVTVIVDPKLGYNPDNRNVHPELVSRKEQIHDLMRRYFSQKTAAELAPRHEEQIKRELVESINRIMGSRGIEDIVFTEFNMIEF